MGEAGFEPAIPKREQGPKPCASANFATRPAMCLREESNFLLGVMNPSF